MIFMKALIRRLLKSSIMRNVGRRNEAKHALGWKVCAVCSCSCGTSSALAAYFRRPGTSPSCSEATVPKPKATAFLQKSIKYALHKAQI